MNKRLLTLSKASYRGISLYELPSGIGVGYFLGWHYYIADTLQEATDSIDKWYSDKNN